MILPTTVNQLVPRQTQDNTWQNSFSSANWIALTLITVCRWRTNGQWKCSQSILLLELSPKKDLHKVSADLWLLFQASWGILRRKCQSWTMCSIRRWYWDCSQQCDGSYLAFLGNLHVESRSRVKTDGRKCYFGVRQVEIFGTTISSEGVSLQIHKVQKLLNKLTFPKRKELFRATWNP